MTRTQKLNLALAFFASALPSMISALQQNGVHVSPTLVAGIAAITTLGAGMCRSFIAVAGGAATDTDPAPAWTRSDGPSAGPSRLEPSIEMTTITHPEVEEGPGPMFTLLPQRGTSVGEGLDPSSTARSQGESTEPFLKESIDD